MNLHVDDVDLSFMQSMDITTIFANILDNAIEANEQVEPDRRYITVFIRQVQGHLAVVVEIRCAGDTPFDYWEGSSDKKNHLGIGLSNVDTALDKYDAGLITERRDYRFVAKFIGSITNFVG